MNRHYFRPHKYPDDGNVCLWAGCHESICGRPEENPIHLQRPRKLADQPRQIQSLAAFFRRLETLLQGSAGSKGYKQPGAQDGSALYDFIASHVGKGSGAHGLGEVVYKVVRYVAKGNLEDLEKAGAWLFLEWDAAKRRQDAQAAEEAAQ